MPNICGPLDPRRPEGLQVTARQHDDLCELRGRPVHGRPAGDRPGHHRGRDGRGEQRACICPVDFRTPALRVLTKRQANSVAATSTCRLRQTLRAGQSDAPVYEVSWNPFFGPASGTALSEDGAQEMVQADGPPRDEAGGSVSALPC